jgi:hypothetical protein
LEDTHTPALSLRGRGGVEEGNCLEDTLTPALSLKGEGGEEAMDQGEYRVEGRASIALEPTGQAAGALVVCGGSRIGV